MPKRIQRKLIKGWRMPHNTVYVGHQTMWNNPLRVGRDVTALFCVKIFETELRDALEGKSRFLSHPAYYARMAEHLDELRGKNLACWCPLDRPCHADVLLKLANKKEGDGDD